MRSKRVACVQLNMHKARLATTTLTEYLLVFPAIAFLTEPYCAYNKIPAMPKGYHLFPSGPSSTNPRAALLVPMEYPATQLPQFSSRDVITAQVTFSQQSYILVSFYDDVNVDPVPQLLQQVHDYAHSRGCLLYTSPSPRDGLLSRMPSSA